MNVQPQATAVLISSIILLGGWVEIGEDLDAEKKEKIVFQRGIEV